MLEPQMIQQLRDYFDPIFQGIKDNLGRMYEQYNEISRLTKNIETQTSNAITSINKDIESLKSDISDQEEDIKELDKRIDAIENSQSDQKVINDRYGRLEKLLWAVLIIVIGMILTLIWNMILYGGLQGVTP